MLKSFPLESMGGVRVTNSSRQCQYSWIAVDLLVLKLDQGKLRSQRGKSIHGSDQCCHCSVWLLCMELLLNSFTEWDMEFVSSAYSFILRNGNNWEADAEARCTTYVTNHFTTLCCWALLPLIETRWFEQTCESWGPDFRIGYFRGS